jgi:dephospho-CoA kinase
MNFRAKNKIVIGLTGAIACGKTTAARIFKKSGAEVICADALAAKRFDLICAKIEKYFKTSDKNKIVVQIFKNISKRKWLEKQIHPFVIKEAKDIIKTTKNDIVIFDAPLLFEAGLKNAFDLTLCVYASPEIRIKRALLKGIDAEDFKGRDRAQIPQEQKAQTADIVLYNNATRKDFENKVIKFYKSLKKEDKYGK